MKTNKIKTMPTVLQLLQDHEEDQNDQDDQASGLVLDSNLESIATKAIETTI